jgi:hypothetical protein
VRKVDLPKAKNNAIETLRVAFERLQKRETSIAPNVLHWMFAMTAVEVHKVWEQYAEGRLIAALNHDATHFIQTNEITGVTHVAVGLAEYLVRGGGAYFDFKSSGDLIGKTSKRVGKPNNPFTKLTPDQKRYLDALAAFRNYIVHGSEQSTLSYKRHANQAFGVGSPAVDAGEFLFVVDHRKSSPLKGEPRLSVLIHMVKEAIQKT